MEAYANNYGEVKLTPEYLAAHTALQELPEREAEICCLQILGPLRQDRFARQYGVSPKRGHLITLLRSAKRRGYSVPWVPDGVLPCPPYDDHGRLWYRGKQPLFYTTETYWKLGRREVYEIMEFCDRWALEFSIGSDSLWFPGATATILYYVPGMWELIWQKREAAR